LGCTRISGGFVGVSDLTDYLLFAQDHGVETRGHAEKVVDTFVSLIDIEIPINVEEGYSESFN